MYDVLIVGGGPAGLSAALALGRARKRVLLCDSGPRRNALAVHLHNFVSRDGIVPQEFRNLSHEELARYPSVRREEVRVQAVAGERGSFRVTLDSGSVEARRILLCTGMIDEMLAIPGFRELWGHSIFQCPYCHGWEVQDGAWGYWARPAHVGHFALFAQQLRAWTRDVTVFTHGAFDVADDARQALTAAGVRIETAVIEGLLGRDGRIEGVGLVGGRVVPCTALFCHPPQRHVELIGTLGVELDDEGYVRIDPMKRETSIPGIYAAGDLITRAQGAILAAAAGTQAAVVINLDVTSELARAGAI